MTEAQLINQLKFRVASLQTNLIQKNKELQQYKTIEIQADSKIKAMNKIQADKVKSLLNSIQILKKQKASIENLSKQHKRSKLIEQLNKQILDQDIVIDVLRNFIYDEKGKEKGRQVCDDIIIKTLTKGPDRIRPLTREQLRMEIQKLKANYINLENKMKIGDKKGKAGGVQADNLSDISSVSQKSFINQNEQIYKKLKQLQQQNQNIKLQMASKGKIIQKLKSQIKQKDKLRSEMQLIVNELEIASRKIQTYERLLRQSKENMNNKIVQLYQRQLKVQELQLNTQENSQRLKHAHQSTNILLQELKQEKQQLNVQIQLMKKQNQTILLENMTLKKRFQEQKSKINEIRDINIKNKEELGDKLKRYEQQITKMMEQRDKYLQLSRTYETTLFKERSTWVEEKDKLIKQIEQLQSKHDEIKLNNKVMEEIDQLRKDNYNLKEIIQSGSGGSTNDNKILLERLQNYRMRLQFYEKDNKGGSKNKQRQLYDTLFNKYNNLLTQFQNYKKQSPTAHKSSLKRKNIIQLSKKQQKKLDNISSGLSNLNLQDIDSDILDNFDSDYEYSLRVNDFDEQKIRNIPKISQQDKQLLKLLNSDLWCFVKDDLVDKKLQDIIQPYDNISKLQDEKLMKRIREIKNLNHPQGKKMIVFDSQLKDIDQMSQSVSITSAIDRQIQKYDSDVNIEIKKGVKGAPKVNMKNYGNISDSYDSNDSNVSSLKSGDSSFVKKAKGEKASVLKIGSKQSLSNFSSNNNESDLMNSDVSSLNINQSALQDMNSDISVDFRKRKNLKKK